MLGRIHPRWRKLFARLHRDEGGNVIVIYVAGSLLVVAMVWALIGTGARAVQKETIQSSADAAAFSAAVIKAKGLNIIAFCNLVMALLLALVMLLRAIKYVLFGVAAAVTICAAIPFTAAICDPFVEPVDQFAFDTYPNLESKAEQFIKTAMNGLHYTERAVAKITPILSFVEAYHIGTDDAYKKNFGKGDLVTISWPLPIEQLPVKDGTCQDLATNAVQYIHDIAELIIGKIIGFLHLPGKIADWVASGIEAVVKPLGSSLCGGGTGVQYQTAQVVYDCNQCQSASNVVGSVWVGNSGIRDANGHYQSPDEPGKTCRMNGMPSWSCNKSAKSVFCSDTDSKEWNWMQFQSCTIKSTSTDTATGESDWPLPLVFTDDWKSKVDTRAFTVLTDSNMADRRNSVMVAERGSEKGNAAPMVNQMMGMAESEWMAWNGHEDLWHMDWRARLVPFTFGATPDGDTSSASDVPAGATGMVSKLLNDFLAKSGTASLKDQFLLH